MADDKKDPEVLKEYPLTQDFIDFNRLNLQHYLWKDLFGYVLHPSVPRDGSNLRIADVGTGTGIWMFDLLPEVDASTQFLGFDNDVSQSTPEAWLPPNIRLREWDIFTDLPSDLVGQFDVVHVRLFGFVVRDDARPTLKKLIQMLKPGGHLQWSEADVESWHIKTTSPDVPTDKLTALWRQSVPEGSRLLPTWVKDLPKTFAEEGLLDVKDDWKDGSAHTTLHIHWCNLHLYEMISRKLAPTNPEKSKEIADLLAQAAAQSRKGAMFAFRRVNVVGKKPGS